MHATSQTLSAVGPPNAPGQTERLCADAAGLARAAALLRAGRTVAIPTETVYGLAADARSDRAVDAIFAAKERPRFNPLIVHVAGLAEAETLARFSVLARRLAERFWPGPLTLVLPRRDGVGLSALVSAGLPSVALRVPAHPVAAALLGQTGLALAAPSANPSGRVSPTRASHVFDGLAGRIAAVLDGGVCAVGLESTVLAVDADRAMQLRPGGVPREAIAAVCLEAGLTLDGAGTVAHPPAPTAPAPSRNTARAPAWPAPPVAPVAPVARVAPLGGGGVQAEASRPYRAPGQMASHYAPGAALRLNADKPRPGEAWLGFGPEPDPNPASGPGRPRLTLSARGDLTEAAAQLFAQLRALDSALGGCGVIAVAPIPERGLGAAINDRLRRAAAPRPQKP
ncbi:MAG: L-threonylcarbamoyladenylate synthase [Pseudomonadota bacterium]